jgi:hypothetical protein
MNLFYSLFFGAGVTAFLYTRIGRRAGYGNTKEVTIVMSVIFVITTAVFFTIIAFFIPK